MGKEFSDVFSNYQMQRFQKSNSILPGAVSAGESHGEETDTHTVQKYSTHFQRPLSFGVCLRVNTCTPIYS